MELPRFTWRLPAPWLLAVSLLWLAASSTANAQGRALQQARLAAPAPDYYFPLTGEPELGHGACMRVEGASSMEPAIATSNKASCQL